MIFPPHSSQNPQNQESRTKSPAILFPFQKITNTRYFFLKISSQKSTSKSVDSHYHLSSIKSREKEKKKFKNWRIQYRKYNISKPHSPPFLRIQRRTENLASAENSDFPSDYRTRSV